MTDTTPDPRVEAVAKALYEMEACQFKAMPSWEWAADDYRDEVRAVASAALAAVDALGDSTPDRESLEDIIAAAAETGPAPYAMFRDDAEHLAAAVRSWFLDDAQIERGALALYGDAEWHDGETKWFIEQQRSGARRMLRAIINEEGE